MDQYFRFRLTKKQTELISKDLKKADEQYKQGRPGAIFCQVWKSFFSDEIRQIIANYVNKL